MVAVLNDSPAGHMEVEQRLNGAVHPKLLAGNDKCTVFAVLNEDRARYRTTENTVMENFINATAFSFGRGCIKYRHPNQSTVPPNFKILF